MNCDCKDWQENIAKVTAPLILQAARSGFDPAVRYDGKPFAYCPWCGSSLINGWLENNRWIDINKQKPPLTAETPETNGFFLALRHDPKRDAKDQYRMEVWFGSTMTDTKYWARIPAYKPKD